MSGRFLVILSLLATAVQAGPRSSPSYSIVTDSMTDGKRTASLGCTNDASIGGIGGLSTVASPQEMAKSGYVGQIYDVISLQINATPQTVNEGGIRQLGASQFLDDSTSTSLLPNSIAWSVQSGPITTISSSGVATAGTVFQDTSATVQGSFAGKSGTLGLTIFNVNNDDFGTYAADGIDDAWQMQYFGADNAAASPNAVSDGSGLTNHFKYLAGLTPNNAASTFHLNVNAVSGQPGQMSITFDPSLSDRHYTVEFSTDLIHWNTLSGPFAGNGSTQIVTDAGAGSGKFYRVQISKP